MSQYPSTSPAVVYASLPSYDVDGDEEVDDGPYQENGKSALPFTAIGETRPSSSVWLRASALLITVGLLALFVTVGPSPLQSLCPPLIEGPPALTEATPPLTSSPSSSPNGVLHFIDFDLHLPSPSPSSVPSTSSSSDDSRPRLWTFFLSQDNAAFWHLGKARYESFSPTHPLHGPEARWNDAASKTFQSFLHSHHYSPEYVTEKGHTDSQVRAECEKRRFAVLSQFEYGFFARVNLAAHLLLLLLNSSFTVILLPVGARVAGTIFNDRGLYDYFRPVSACQRYVMEAIHDQHTPVIAITDLVPGFGNGPDPSVAVTKADIPQMDAALQAGTLPWTQWKETLNAPEHVNKRFIALNNLWGLIDITWWSSYPFMQSMHLPIRYEMFGTDHSDSLGDSLWSQFVIHQVQLFFCRPQPRVQLLIDAMIHSMGQRTAGGESPSLVAFHIRRDDKASEDPYVAVHQQFRPLRHFVIQASWWERHTRTASHPAGPYSHFLVITDDPALEAQVVLDSQTQYSGDDDALTHSWWYGKQRVSCSGVLDSSAVSGEYKAALAQYTSVEYPGKEKEMDSLLQKFDCFFAEVAVASTVSELTVLTEGSNVGDHARRYRCALARNSGCHQAQFASVSPSTLQYSPFILG